MNKKEIAKTLRLEAEYTRSYSVNNKSIVGMNEEYIDTIKINAFAYDTTSPSGYEKKIATVIIDKIKSSFTISKNENYNMAEFMDSYGNDEGIIALNLGLYSEYTGFSDNKKRRIYDKMIEALSISDLYYIRKLKVEPKYRKLGIGKKILNKLPFVLKDLTHQKKSVIVLRAIPFEIDEDTNKKLFTEYEKKLFRFYQNCGFEHIDNNIFLMID